MNVSLEFARQWVIIYDLFNDSRLSWRKDESVCYIEVHRGITIWCDLKFSGEIEQIKVLNVLRFFFICNNTRALGFL